MKLIVLGTGSNGGIPQVDCDCRVCVAARKYPEESRTRSSIALALDDGKYLIFDATPDIKIQICREGIYGKDILAIFLTHAHYDHIGGLMEFLMGKPLAINVHTHPLIAQWLIDHHRLDGRDVFEKYLTFNSNYQNVIFEGVAITGFEIPHTSSIFGPTLGYKITTRKKIFVYMPNIARIDDIVLEILQGCDFAILDGTFYDRSVYNHISIKETIQLLRTKKPDRIYFTHINHTEGLHEELSRKLATEEGQFFLLTDGDTLYIE